MSQIRTLNDFAFLRIPTMSMPEASGVASLGEGDCGDEGTNGLGATTVGVGDGRVGCIGAACRG